MRVFTDGACKSNGKAMAQASYAGYFPDNKELSFAKKMPEGELQTNQRAELKAIHDSVKIASDNSITELHIFTDSVYSKNCLTVWLSGWVKNKWKTAEGNDVKHRDLIEPTSVLLSKMEYTITYVKAHTGKTDELSIGNDVADKMATGVLIDKEDPPTITRTENVLGDLPLRIMGPPLEEVKIIEWCKTHLDLLDKKSLDVAMSVAFQKTMKKNGYSVELQKINKSRVVRISSKIITERIIKEE